MLSIIRDILAPSVDAGLGAIAVVIAAKVREGYYEYKQLTHTMVDKLTAMDKRVTTLERHRGLAAVAGVA